MFRETAMMGWADGWMGLGWSFVLLFGERSRTSGG